MSNYSQYPQPPLYPQYGNGPTAPQRPPLLQKAVNLTYLGAGLALVGGIVNVIATRDSTLIMYSAQNGNVHTTSPVVSGIIGVVLDAALWLWMAWKVGAGRQWARVLSTVFFGIFCLGLLLTFLGAQPVSVIVNLLVWAVGLSVVILMYKPECSQYFAAVKQAKLGLYGPGYAPYQPVAGYGQPAGHGQPSPYAQPQYGQPQQEAPAPQPPQDPSAQPEPQDTPAVQPTQDPPAPQWPQPPL